MPDVVHSDTKAEIFTPQSVADALDAASMSELRELMSDLRAIKNDRLRFKGQTHKKFEEDPSVIWQRGYIVGRTLGLMDAAKITRELGSQSATLVEKPESIADL